MIESSAIFILFQFVQKFGTFTERIPLWLFASVAGGIVAVMLLVSILFPKRPPDSPHVDVRTIMRRTALVIAVIGFVIILAGYGSVFFPQDTTVRGMSEPTFLALLVLAVACAVTMIVSAIVYATGDTREPDPSRLTRRQMCKAIIVCASIVFVFCALSFVSKQVFTVAVLAVFIVLEAVSIFYWFYDPFIYVLSRLSVRRHAHRFCDPTPGKLNRYAILICAHNEEKVIDRAVESALKAAYPSERYDVYVICDNCTDDTAQKAEAAGAQVCVRDVPEKAGKGYALDWMFDRLEVMAADGVVYDAYVIIDADNVVGKNFLAAINREMNVGYGVLQSYLDTKNPSDSWVSKSSALAYCISDTMFEEAHFSVGLSAQIGGTGMVIRPEVLRDIPWHTDSLTEDLVYTTSYVLKTDKPVAWVADAKVFDEKPVKLKASLNQRTRWMQGHMAALFSYGPRCIWEGIRTFSFRKIDIGLYLAKPYLNLMMLVTYAARLFITFIMPQSVLAKPLLMDFTSATLLLAAYILFQLFILRDRNHLRYALWLPFLWIFSYTWYPPIVRGVLKRKELTWVSTSHDRNIAITELADEDPLSSEEFEEEE